MWFSFVQDSDNFRQRFILVHVSMLSERENKYKTNIWIHFSSTRIISLIQESALKVYRMIHTLCACSKHSSVLKQFWERKLKLRLKMLLYFYKELMAWCYLNITLLCPSWQNECRFVQSCRTRDNGYARYNQTDAESSSDTNI